jgi:nucleoside-diphosphate-sugar epimerase
MNILNLVGRNSELFCEDISQYESRLSAIVQTSRFLVIGGAGSIGQAVTKEIFKRNPRKLHVVDISENNMVELVRDIRSSFGYIDGDFQTFALDVGSVEYDAFWKADGQFDYVLNLSALKHVRSEKDPFTLMRMIEVNIFNTDKTLRQCIENGVKKYFCVSTDKAANPVNMMGASKRIMEMFVNRRSNLINVSMARFANVAFSDGSLLHGFEQRITKRQPIVAPNDIKRYFLIPKESGELCLMSCIFGENRDIFFPKLSENLHLITFAEIAGKYLRQKGLEPFHCQTEEEARNFFNDNSTNQRINPSTSRMLSGQQINKSTNQQRWPCLFITSDTTGEKDFEEFFTEHETLDMEHFHNLGIIKNELENFDGPIEYFEYSIKSLKKSKSWTKQEIVDLFHYMIPDFGHKETGKYLDEKM